jgi:tetratricopeptide (TPR) repeat protein
MRVKRNRDSEGTPLMAPAEPMVPLVVTPTRAPDEADYETISGVIEIDFDSPEAQEMLAEIEKINAQRATASGMTPAAPLGWGEISRTPLQTRDVDETPLVASQSRHTWTEFRDGQQESELFGGTIPLVSRRTEIASVYNPLRMALNNSKFRVIWLVGPTGVGRSRLVTTVEHAADPEKRGIGWYRIGAEEQVLGPPNLAGRLLLEIIGGQELLRDPRPFERVRLNVAALLGEASATAAMTVVAPLLGLHAPEDRSSGELAVEAPMTVSMEFVATLLRQRGRAGPCVVAVDAGETLQLDELTALVRALQSALTNSPVALLVETAEEPDPGLDVERVELGPLDPAATLQLAQKLLQPVSNAPETLAVWVTEKSKGLPGRLVDTLRGMVAAGEIVERGGLWTWRGEWLAERANVRNEDEGLPGRLARLPQSLRELVEAAAIFGQNVWFGGLLSVMRGSQPEDPDILSERDRVTQKALLLQLQYLDVLKFVEISEDDRDLEFGFVHVGDPALLVLQMSDEKRQLLARLAAQWLARRPRQDPVAETARIAELYELGGRRRLSAQHFLEAGNAARTVGQLHRAIALFAAGARSAHADNADLAADLRLAHGGALLRLGRYTEAEAILMESLRMARCLDDDLRSGTAQLRIAQVARASGRYDMAEQFLEAALSHLRIAGAHRWIADVNDELGMVHLVRGGLDAYALALQHFNKALGLRRRSEDLRVVARSLCHIARVQTGRGYFVAAMDAVAEATNLCEQVQERWGLAEARMVQGEVMAASGRVKGAMQMWSQALELASEVGDRARQLEIAVLQAETQLALGKWQDAAARMVDAIDVARELANPELLSSVYRVLANISLARQALETADMDSERAVEIARSSGAQVAVARAQIVRGCVLGTRALAEKGPRATVLDRRTTEAFEEAFDALYQMGDLVRLAGGLRSCVEYLAQRGGGPRLTAVQGRLQEIESSLASVNA